MGVNKIVVAVLCLLISCDSVPVDHLSVQQLVHSSLEVKQPLQGLLKEHNEDMDLTTTELIVKYGYPVETHTVQTEDGYILTLHRIPYGKNSPAGPNRPPVYVQHGLLSSSVDWIIMGPESGLGYLLADAGYDVWLANARGNTWSKKHATLEVDSDEFWDFSWHEMGVYDLPAVIDHILEQNGQDKLFYVGHSMGTTMFYVMAAEKPEYNDKIRAMFSLAPIAFMPNVHSRLLRLIAEAGDQIGALINLIGIHEILPNTELMGIIGELFCRDEAVTQAICSNILFLICGYDSKEMNTTMLPVVLAHTPAGAATKNFLHYAQSIKTGKFRQYDYGTKGNQDLYGSNTPPDYDLSKITAPVALHYSDNDWLGVPEDVMTLGDQLPNLIGKFRVPLAEFNHLDYLLAIHVKDLLYDRVISLINRY